MKTQPAGRTVTERLLLGKTMLVTRAAAQSREFGALLESDGATVVYFPTIEIVDPESWVDCDRAIADIDQYYGLIFTSQNSVRNFIKRISSVRPESLSIIQQRKVYAVGERTKVALEEYDLPVAFAPKEFTSEDLGRALQRGLINERRFLHVRGNLGGEEIRHAIESHGGHIDEVVIYRTVKPELRDASHIEQSLRKGEIDLVIFFSPSSIQNFFDVISPDSVQSVRLAAVGSITARALEALGLPVHIVPPKSTSVSFAQSIAQYYGRP